MTNWKKISESICRGTDATFEITHATPLSGGYTSQTWHLEGRSELKPEGATTHYFVKLNSADKAGMYVAESAGLAALAATHTVRVPEVIAQGIVDQHTFLVLEYFDLTSRGDARLLGNQLAALHRTHAKQYGWERNNTLGHTPQQNNWSNDWLTFWRDHRLGFQLDLAARNGFGGALQEMGRRLMGRLADVLGDHCPAPSLLHGDLWGGNHGYLANGTPVLYDPAVYYGDREADLAMTELFGGFAPEFYAAYHAAYPLDDGYARRKTLYNLYHILNHCNMIGSGYVAQAEGMMQRLLDGLRG